MKCSDCGRELPGVEFEGFEPKHWQCAECSGEPDNSLFCRAGDAVKYTHTHAGTESCRILANKYLVPGNTYYVDTIKVGRSFSYIKVQGLKYWFNSVLLERVV